MRSSDIAALLVAGMQQQVTGATELGWHTGVVLSWDDLTGLNTVEIKGQAFSNLKVLSTGAVQPFQDGDVVGVLRVGTQYFILGKIRAAGAGAGERIESRTLRNLATMTDTNNQWTDLAGGPEVSLYVGSTRRVLVMHSARLFVANGSVTQGVEVAGASNIPVGSQVENADLLNQNPLSVWAAVSASTVLTADSGLQQGTNVFRCRYQADAHDNPNPSVLQVASRTITVIPF